jgi:hypothetical protein
VRVRAQEKISDTEAKIRDLEAIRSALRRLVDRCAAHGRPNECALMQTIGADDDDSGRS